MQGVELVWYAVIGNFLVKELLYDAAARLYTVFPAMLTARFRRATAPNI